MSSHPSEPDRVESLSPEDLRNLRNLSDRNEIRRTYAKLVRRFSPETHPQEFQQIREAYENAIRSAEWKRLIIAEETSTVDAADTAEVSGTPEQPPLLEGSKAHPELHSTPPATPRQHNDSQDSNSHSQPKEDFEGGHKTLSPTKTQEIWSQFKSAPTSAVVQSMLEACEGVHSSPDAFLMLYWMEKLRPDLGRGLSAHEVLLDGLRRYSNDGRLHELLFRETEDDPRARDPESLQKVLTVYEDVRRLPGYLRLRWAILSEGERWVQLRTEMDVVRPRLSVSNRSHWVDLLLTINEHLIFSTYPAAKALLESIEQEIGASFDLQKLFRHRLELLDVLTFVWTAKSSYSFHDPLSRLLTSRRHTARTQFRQEAFGIIAGWISWPTQALDSMTRLANEFADAFWLLQQYMDLLPGAPELSPDDAPELTLAIRTRVAEFCEIDYAFSRVHFLVVCRDECIPPNQILRLLRTLASEIPAIKRNLQLFEADTPLLVACHCFYSFLCSC